MDMAPSSPRTDRRAAQLASTAFAIGALDAAVASSPVARFWHERASVVGLAHGLALAGVNLTPAEFFRAVVGLVEPIFMEGIDRAVVTAIVAEWQAALAPAAMTAQLLGRLQSGSRLLVAREWALPRRPSAAARALVEAVEAAAIPHDAGTDRADVGTALAGIGAAVAGALTGLRALGERDWPGWLLAAQLPSLLAAARITATPLPCLTGLVRSMRFSSLGGGEIEALLLPRLGEQARNGLVLLRRLEACAQAWRERLHGLTARSRAGAAAGLFLVWPALTRGQVAAALGVTPPGAGTLLAMLAARDIVERVRVGPATYFVAPESLGEFKLAARQGRQIPPPSAPAFAEFDAELAAFDLLARRFASPSPHDGLG